MLHLTSITCLTNSAAIGTGEWSASLNWVLDGWTIVIVQWHGRGLSVVFEAFYPWASHFDQASRDMAAKHPVEELHARNLVS